MRRRRTVTGRTRRGWQSGARETWDRLAEVLADWTGQDGLRSGVLLLGLGVWGGFWPVWMGWTARIGLHPRPLSLRARGDFGGGVGRTTAIRPHPALSLRARGDWWGGMGVGWTTAIRPHPGPSPCGRGGDIPERRWAWGSDGFTSGPRSPG